MEQSSRPWHTKNELRAIAGHSVITRGTPMKRVLLAVMLIVASELACQSARAETKSESEPPEGFESIFNGRDLTGWEGHPGDWKVTEGSLTGSADGSLKY